MTARLVAKIAIPAARRCLCRSGESAAPTVAASNGSAGYVASLSRSSMTQVWNFITAPCRGRFSISSAARPEGLPGTPHQKPLAALHDKLQVLDDRRLVGENPRGRHIKSDRQHRYLWRCAIRLAHNSSFRLPDP